MLDTDHDIRFPTSLPYGSLFFNGKDYYLCGTYPIGEVSKAVFNKGQVTWFSILTVNELLSLLLEAAAYNIEQHNYPKNIEYDIKVYTNDTVLPMTTDGRGYPRSCGTGNANKNIVVIVRGDKK